MAKAKDLKYPSIFSVKIIRQKYFTHLTSKFCKDSSLMLPRIISDFHLLVKFMLQIIDLLAILQTNLDRALFSNFFIQDVRSSGDRASITLVQVRKFYKVHQNIVRF